jgi:hypothetical protein
MFNNGAAVAQPYIKVVLTLGVIQLWAQATDVSGDTIRVNRTIPDSDLPEPLTVEI